MKRIAIIGAGQAGLQLGLGLLDAGYEVTLVSGRSPEEIRTGPVMSSQCMFDSALQAERDLGLNFWEQECPQVQGIGFTIPGEDGARRVEWSARLDDYAQSVDQRVKIPGWMRRFKNRGGQILIEQASIGSLEEYSKNRDLVIVATGRGDLGHLFERDLKRSPFDKPQRTLAMTYVRNMKPRPSFPAVNFSLIPGMGEYFAFPALTVTGPCDIMVFEAAPGSPLDCWSDIQTPEEHLERSKIVLEKFFPWEAERCAEIELTDDDGILIGKVTPVVRHPVGTLPSGRQVLGMADVVVLNDPITGQGSNNAARCAEIYLKSIEEHGEKTYDAAWMQHTFDRYWTGYAKWVTEWTNLMLHPPAHVNRILESARTNPAVASAFVNGFDDPRTLFPWFMEAAEAENFLKSSATPQAGKFDARDYRKALGQFATGVTVVTTTTKEGRRVGITVNSFSSVSLNPPLVLWSIAKNAASYPDFIHATHFVVNVLAAGQHHLSRQFATPLADKFMDVECAESADGLPRLCGALAHFVCRVVEKHDGGDHVILIGEVLEYKSYEGEPLVFHSGRYRVATRHPEIAD